MQNFKCEFKKFRTLRNKQMSFQDVIADIIAYREEDPSKEYYINVGSDSEGYGDVPYVSAIVARRVGHGARGYICKNVIKTPNRALHNKIYNEAMLSLALGQEIFPALLEAGMLEEHFVIHVDVGINGQTKDMIKAITGMVKGFGFQVSIKPDSFAASSVADRYALPPRQEISASRVV